MEESRHMAEMFLSDLDNAFEKIKYTGKIIRWDRQEQIVSEIHANNLEELKILCEQAEEEYDSTVEGKARVVICREAEDGGLTIEQYDIGYCQKYRDWEDFLAKYPEHAPRHL